MLSRVARSVAVLALLALLAAVATAQIWPPWTPSTHPARAVTLPDGTLVNGVLYESAESHDLVPAYLGIPFAQPPLGPLRWAMPQPWKGGANVTVNATAFAPMCPQLPSSGTPHPSISEDCLYLNVFAPHEAPEHPLPVMVFIYGGSFDSGGTSVPYYNGMPLVAREDVIVVTVAYRVGPFGFLALPELAAESGVGTTGNSGIQDQRMGMVWVQENIAAFGGDPSRVTLFGESAGAVSVCIHYVSALSEGLFSRVIMESSDCNATQPLATAYAQGAEFTKAMGCEGSSSDTLTCLRAGSMEAVLTALPLGGVGESWGASYNPVDDGYEFSVNPNAALAAGTVKQTLTPALIGTNHNEATLFVMVNLTLVNMSAAGLAAMVETQFGPVLAPRVLAQYPLSQFAIAPPAEAWAAILSDVVFKCPTWTLANQLAARGVPVYRYDLAYVPQCGLFPPQYAALFGVYHYAEIPYVFGVTPPTCNFTADDLEISEAFQTFWGSWAYGEAGWPAYTTATQTNVVIDVPVGLESQYDQANCMFWNTIPQAAAVAAAARSSLAAVSM